MLEKRRVRRPYEKKQVSKAGAFIFGLGLAALTATVLILSIIILPSVNTRLDTLAYHARTYYRKLVPHPKYLPTPAPAEVAAAPSLPPVSAPSIPLDEPLAAETAGEEAVVTPTTLTLQETVPSGQNPIPVAAEGSVQTNTAESVQLTGLRHQWQTWNNCGPATITTYMSYFGRFQTQAEAALFLKPNRDDKNVSPQELAAYARSVGMEAIVRQGGSVQQLKQFLNNNIPVLVETWLIHDGDGLGHYRLISGYDEATAQFTTTDSLNGPSYKVSYQQFDADWRVFNRLYVVVYGPDQSDKVAAIIGQDMNQTTLYERLAVEAQQEIEVNPNDPLAFFNQGEALTRLGHYEEAVAAFDQARQLGLHWRRLWYQFTPFEAYYAVGRYQDVLDLSEATLRSTSGSEEAYFYQGLALHATQQPGAEEQFEAALNYNPNFAPAAEALNQFYP
jgi:predicted double-glycine peptidase